jgi:hypothetical protein
MTLARLIAPNWLLADKPGTRKVLEGVFSPSDIRQHNNGGYNVYYLPNYPKDYKPGITLDGTHIDTFEYVFVDMDLKDGVYTSKDEFYEVLADKGIPPTRVVDSGGGVHAYWLIEHLDAMSFLRFQRRLCRLYNTDEAISKIFQLMRIPGTKNTKIKGKPRACHLLYEDLSRSYTASDFDKLLPPITIEDEEYCKRHFDSTYNIKDTDLTIEATITPKWGKLLKSNPEVKALWTGSSDDRSRDDYRLGHLLFANSFTKEEAIAILMNGAKASQRAPIHRRNYAENIAEKIWTYEISEDKNTLDLSSSVKDILQKSGKTLKGIPFRCHPCVDNTAHGFRLGQVIGLVAGSGVGKTAFAMNLFLWFAQTNPDYHHFFIPLEQPANEIADRWQTMCRGDASLHDKVHVISNYDDDGNFRHLSFDEIRQYIQKWQTNTGKKVGCVVIDHIGALKKKGRDGENQDLMDICHDMKAFAVQTNTLLIMQSQTSREKAGIGDLELDKDAAYGTMYFEAYTDYMITMWQPLKRCYNESKECPTVTAFKFCKIRHKKANKDVIKEDVPYFLYFDSETELLNAMNQSQQVAFNYWLQMATNKRKKDRKTDLVAYTAAPQKEGEAYATTVDSNRNTGTH